MDPSLTKTDPVLTKTDPSLTQTAPPVSKAADDFSSTFNRAMKAFRDGDFALGESLLKSTLKMEDKQGASDLNRSKSMLALADFYRTQKRFPEAEALYRQLLNKFENNPNSGKELAAVKSKLAALFKSQQRYDDALELYKQLLESEAKQNGENSAEVATVHANLGLLYQRMNKMKEAELEEQTAIKLFQEKLGPDSLQVAQCMSDLATQYMMQRQLDKAVPLLESALAVFNKKDSDGLISATCSEQLGTAYGAQGRYSDAEVLSRKALKIFQQKLGADNMEVAVTLSNLGNRLAKQGKNQEALDCYNKSLAIQQKRMPDSPDQMANLHGIAEIYVSQADYKKAEPLLRKDLSLREKRWGDRHLSLVPALKNLANCLVLEGMSGEEPDALMAKADSILSDVPTTKRKMVDALISQDLVQGLDISPGKKGKGKSNSDKW
jgi:tetratricopeptide (TPR) repeat protein